MPDLNELYEKFQARLEDFWGRRLNAPHHERTIHIFGQPVLFDGNDPLALDSAGLAERMYSQAPVRATPPWKVHLTVHNPDRDPGQPPERLVDLIHYAGTDDWLSIDLDAWGNCFVDLPRAEAHAVLSSSLARQPEQVCLVLLNTILTNLATRHGFSMLHASALVQDDRILLLMAPHGTGKSTTSLRLLSNGYKLLSDSQIYLGEREDELWMGGFPIGRVKLRGDILPLFPELAGLSRPEPVRDETKHMVELERVDPALAVRDMIPVRKVKFCLLTRGTQVRSEIQPLTADKLWPEIMVNSLHYGRPEVWQQNLRRIALLLEKAELHHLRIGTSEEDILQTVNQMWTSQP
ncbi:MAG TPA: hypothetical protein VGJ22_12630 [Anaerolineales bacterium]